jgi:hypothetical protein
MQPTRKNLAGFILSLGMLILFSCSQSPGPSSSQAGINDTILSEAGADKQVEVIYLHGRTRCPSCTAIENAAKKTVEQFFGQETESGIVSFSIINIDLPENRYLAEKYMAFGPTLLVCEKTGAGESIKDLTGEGFRFAMRDEARFVSLLRYTIEESLKR